MDILTIFKVIALAVFTLAAVFVMLAAATMWRTERAAAGRINRLISADPAEASGDKERADNALLDVTEITRRVSEEPEEAEAEAEAEAEDVPAEIARLKEEVSFLNECREADSRRIQNLEERLDSLEYCDGDESCDAYPGNDDDDCDDGAVPVAEVVKTLIVTADIPTLVARAWREDVEAFKQALKAAVNSTARDIEADTMESPAMKRHCEEQDEELHEMWLEMMDESIWKNIVRMEQEKGNPVAEKLAEKLHKPKRPSPSKYPLFEAKPSSKEWRQRGGLVIDRRMDELRGADNHSVWAARFQVNYVRKMDSIPLRVMAGVREAVDEAEKSAEKENYTCGLHSQCWPRFS